MKTWYARLAVILGIIWLCAPAPAIARDCDMNVSPSASPLNYKPRESRCEGVFREQVVGRTNLRIIGYHANRASFGTPDARSVLLKALSIPRGRSKVMKVVSRRPNENYQMDTAQLGTDGTYPWPLDILKKVAPPLRAIHLAGLVCVDECGVGRTRRSTLAPIQFPSSRGASATLRPRIIIKSDTSLKSVRVAMRDASGHVNTRQIASNVPYGAATTYILPNLDGAYCDITITVESQRGARDQIEARLLLP